MLHISSPTTHSSKEVIFVINNNDRIEPNDPVIKTERRISEISGLLWRVMESFEIIRFGVFALLGANVVLILVIIRMLAVQR